MDESTIWFRSLPPEIQGEIAIGIVIVFSVAIIWVLGEIGYMMTYSPAQYEQEIREHEQMNPHIDYRHGYGSFAVKGTIFVIVLIWLIENIPWKDLP